AMDAHAYTFGRNIVFGRGMYAPGSEGGRSLLAHELAHVVQQSAAPPMVQREAVDDEEEEHEDAEEEADAMADAALAGERVPEPQHGGGERVQFRRRRRRRRRRGGRQRCNCYCHTEYGQGQGSTRSLSQLRGFAGDSRVANIHICRNWCAQLQPTVQNYVPPRAGAGPHGFPFASCGERGRRVRTYAAYRRPSQRPAQLRPGYVAQEQQPAQQQPQREFWLVQMLEPARAILQRRMPAEPGYLVVDEAFFRNVIGAQFTMSRVGAMGVNPTQGMNWITAGSIAAAAISATVLLAVIAAPAAPAAPAAAPPLAAAAETFASVGAAARAGYTFLQTAAANETVQTAMAAGAVCVIAMAPRTAEASGRIEAYPVLFVPEATLRRRVPQGTAVRPGTSIYFQDQVRYVIGGNVSS
ncbi:MAG: DUF4157 domain-containing protein, partial [Thermoanaerobaculia bacterium]